MTRAFMAGALAMLVGVLWCRQALDRRPSRW